MAPDGVLEFAFRQHEGLAPITGPAADLIGEIVQPFLPRIVIRKMVRTNDEDIQVTSGTCFSSCG